VYVAKTLATGKKVAIKEMDLSHQPRKELIVNEILVMKESQHPNIVNFLESYLVKNNELWVVMEFMEGGALTDIIENNTLEEDQISSICFEVSILYLFVLCALVVLFEFTLIGICLRPKRHVRVLVICTVKASSIVTSSRITFSSTHKAESRSVRCFLSSHIIQSRMTWLNLSSSS